MAKNKKNQSKDIEAYEQMLEHIRQMLESEETTLSKAFETAKEALHQLEDLTYEEVENIAHSLQRDLHDAGSFLRENEEELKNWIHFDWELIEARLWDNFVKAADKTVLDWQAFQFRIERGPVYRTGEMIGLGTLQCDQCGELLHFTKVSHIPTCPQCHQKEFSRLF